MSSLSAEDLRRTKQIISTTKLITVAESYGFSVRPAKGDHLRYTHKNYPDINGNLVASTNKLGSQRSLSDAILEVQRRDTKADLTAKNEFSQAADKAAAERLEAIKKQLPHYVEAFYGQGDEVIVRDKQAPQIGFTLHSPQEDRLIENKMRHELDGMKRSFFEALNRSRMQYDIDFSFDKKKGALSPLTHSVYDLAPLTLPPYPEAAEPMSALTAYQERVLEIDMDHSARREELLAKRFIDQVLVAHTQRRGNRNNHVSYNIPGVDKSLRFTFSTFSNKRVEGDGKHSRISAAELEKLENTVASIEQRIRGIPTSNHRRHDKVA